MENAPIVLFVYNRPWHTRQTIEALQKNTLAKESELFIYSDGPKNEKAVFEVTKVRDYIKAVDSFRKVIIVERDCNWGLAKNIIEGVTKTVDKYGKVIVLEDDLVTSPLFLNFMNNALESYLSEKHVWHISGWNYPIEPEGLPEAFFWRLMNCWGWGTWADRWQHFEKNPKKLIDTWSRDKIKAFDLDGVAGSWSQILANFRGKINTWAVFWHASIFEHNGLCMNPAVSYVNNIGHDGSGQNCGRSNVYTTELNKKNIKSFPSVLEEHTDAVNRIKRFYIAMRPSLLCRFLNRIKNADFSLMEIYLKLMPILRKVKT